MFTLGVLPSHEDRTWYAPDYSAHVRGVGGTGILPVGLGGIGILPMIHGLEAHATRSRIFIHVLKRS